MIASLGFFVGAICIAIALSRTLQRLLARVARVLADRLLAHLEEDRRYAPLARRNRNNLGDLRRRRPLVSP